MTDSLPTHPHLLVGVDFSDGAHAALAEARWLAGCMQIALHLVHVRDPIHDAGTVSTPAAEQWLSEANVASDQLYLRAGQPRAELSRAPAAGAVALVIGSHGRSGFQPVALGSTAVRLGLVAPCPVIVVNPRTRAARAARTPADHCISL